MKKNEIIEGQVTRETEVDPILEARVYFEQLKKSTKEENIKSLEMYLEAAEKLVKKYTITRQTSAKERVEQYVNQYKKEIAIMNAGYTKYFKRSDIEKGIDGTRNIYISTLSEYERDIPDDVVEIVADVLEKELFDEIFIVFTDYSSETKDRGHQKQVERDPVMFGVVVKETTYGRKWFSERVWYICDWIDEYCELTLSKMIEVMGDNGVEGSIVYDAAIPTTTDELLADITKTEEYTDIEVEKAFKNSYKVAKNKSKNK